MHIAQAQAHNTKAKCSPINVYILDEAKLQSHYLGLLKRYCFSRTEVKLNVHVNIHIFVA